MLGFFMEEVQPVRCAPACGHVEAAQGPDKQ